jgi:hypothetical protein
MGDYIETKGRKNKLDKELIVQILAIDDIKRDKSNL